MERDLLEEEEEAGVMRINLTGAAMAVVVVAAAAVAVERPQVEFGTMAMTFVSSLNQSTHPGHYAFPTSYLCGVCMCVVVCTWRSKDISWELGLSFYHVGPRC